VSKHDNTFSRVLSGTANANIDFGDLCMLMNKLGFRERVNSSHRIYSKEGIDEIINLQPGRDGKAKPYQVRQVRQMIQRYELKLS
jgi:hypothetical protein